jgi:hypothetical protein
MVIALPPFIASVTLKEFGVDAAGAVAVGAIGAVAVGCPSTAQRRDAAPAPEGTKGKRAFVMRMQQPLFKECT